MTKEKLSIDELARRLHAERVFGYSIPITWEMLDTIDKNKWRRVARLARKLESQPASKPRPEKPLVCEACGNINRSVRRRTDWEGNRFYSCERCWHNMAGGEFDQRVAAHRAKKARK